MEPTTSTHVPCKCGHPVGCSQEFWINVEETFVYLYTDKISLVILDVEAIDQMIASLENAKEVLLKLE